VKKVLVATHNIGKLEEYKNFLSPIGFRVKSLADEGIETIAPETGNSYLEIAQKKAVFYARFSKLPIIAEDSGLEILALRGFPGIRSSTWSEGSARQKNLAIIKKMDGITNRRATFKVVIVYLHKKKFVTFTGQMSGEIAQKPSGVMGFSYDPIFYVPSLKRTLAQITQFEKNQLSFRGLVMKKLVSYLKRYKPE
jgi:XTP/dITP diphosphohydrolase